MFNAPVGSPPRMRGKELASFFFYQIPGITPAYAGKRGRDMTEEETREGSPPRMRGKD